MRVFFLPLFVRKAKFILPIWYFTFQYKVTSLSAPDKAFSGANTWKYRYITICLSPY